MVRLKWHNLFDKFFLKVAKSLHYVKISDENFWDMVDCGNFLEIGYDGKLILWKCYNHNTNSFSFSLLKEYVDATKHYNLGQLFHNEIYISDVDTYYRKRYEEELDYNDKLMNEIEELQDQLIQLNSKVSEEDYISQIWDYIIKKSFSLKKSSKKRTTNKRKTIPHKTRIEVFKHDKGICNHCGKILDVENDDWEIDHILPVSKGGDNRKNNLQLLCKSCNRKKSNRTDILQDQSKLKDLTKEFGVI